MAKKSETQKWFEAITGRSTGGSTVTKRVQDLEVGDVVRFPGARRFTVVHLPPESSKHLLPSDVEVTVLGENGAPIKAVCHKDLEVEVRSTQKSRQKKQTAMDRIYRGKALAEEAVKIELIVGLLGNVEEAVKEHMSGKEIDEIDEIIMKLVDFNRTVKHESETSEDI